MTGIILRIIRQMVHDKRSLGLIVFAPIFIISLLYLLLGDSPYVPTVAVEADLPESVVSQLESPDLSVMVLQNEDDPDELLKAGTIDAFLTVGSDGVTVRMLEADNVKTAKITSAIQQVISGSSAGLRITYLFGANLNSFDSLSYVLLGVMAFFIVFLLAGISFIRERTIGTLERLMLTPVRRSSVALGYTFGFGLFAILQSIILILFTEYVLGLEIAGSILLAVLIMILLAFSAIVTGMLVSIFANNEFQVVQFIPVVIIPQIFFSGMIPIDTLPYHLGLLSYVMPVYYGCTALKAVIIQGSSLAEVWPELLILLAFILLLSVLNSFALKKYRSL